ncbi:hypothetical protein [Shewanella baltica]|uniref:hypothetical protein n=1 Tax=Shewanella baltica TaxID=62322 RepID=UPI003D7B9466
MTCFNTGLAYLVDYNFWNQRTDIITAAVAVIALFFAWYQVRAARKESRRATAYAAYDNYLKLCLDNQSFAMGTESEIKNDDKNYLKYKWFVTNMLFAFEQVLEVCKDDPTWEKTVTSQLRRHKWHLEHSKSVQRKEWSEKLIDLILKVVE